MGKSKGGELKYLNLEGASIENLAHIIDSNRALVIHLRSVLDLMVLLIMDNIE